MRSQRLRPCCGSLEVGSERKGGGGLQGREGAVVSAQVRVWDCLRPMRGQGTSSSRLPGSGVCVSALRWLVRLPSQAVFS
jgi:hypothetical protein